MNNEERIAVARAAVTEALARYNLHEIATHLVGSTYIKDRTDGDVDLLALLDLGNHQVHGVDCMAFDGWAYGGSVGLGNDHWMSWKKLVNGVEVNMLLTDRIEYLSSWLTAAEVCRFLHLQGHTIKPATVHGIHEIIMDDSTADAENARRIY